MSADQFRCKACMGREKLPVVERRHRVEQVVWSECGCTVSEEEPKNRCPVGIKTRRLVPGLSFLVLAPRSSR